MEFGGLHIQQRDLQEAEGRVSSESRGLAFTTVKALTGLIAEVNNSLDL